MKNPTYPNNINTIPNIFFRTFALISGNNPPLKKIDQKEKALNGPVSNPSGFSNLLKELDIDYQVEDTYGPGKAKQSTEPVELWQLALVEEYLNKKIALATKSVRNELKDHKHDYNAHKI